MVKPNQVWVTDITYIRTWQGWLYLAVVIDLFARNVVGWSMKPTLSRELALDALLMAVWRRKPAENVIVHSDQGSQYGSDDWQRFCRANNLAPSMSRRGNCWDNAVAESFFSSLKKERIRKRIYKTRDMARADIFDYIEVFYNRTRRHSHLGGVSPEAFEKASPGGQNLSTGMWSLHLSRLAVLLWPIHLALQRDVFNGNKSNNITCSHFNDLSVTTHFEQSYQSNKRGILCGSSLKAG